MSGWHLLFTWCCLLEYNINFVQLLHYVAKLVLCFNKLPWVKSICDCTIQNLYFLSNMHDITGFHMEKVKIYFFVPFMNVCKLLKRRKCRCHQFHTLTFRFQKSFMVWNTRFICFQCSQRWFLNCTKCNVPKFSSLNSTAPSVMCQSFHHSML